LCIDSVLKHWAADRKRRLSALPNVSPYTYDDKTSGFTRSYIYTYTYIHTHDISRLRVNLLSVPVGDTDVWVVSEETSVLRIALDGCIRVDLFFVRNGRCSHS
jgi:hypothetical protein